MPESQQYLRTGNANDHARLHVSSNAFQYGAHTSLPLIHAGDAAGTGIRTS
jgi:hypothetical protein